jgi:hypothetical protein
MKIFIKAITLFFITLSVNAQIDLPRQSPSANISQTIGYTTITIDYCRPGIHERQIWGGLVPYNQVWRTGANEATTIQFTTDVTVEGNKVPAGRYSLFTIPSETVWTIILNKTDKQWGAFNYKQDDDLLRFNVKPEKSSFTERLQFSFSNITDSTVSIVLNWENLQISFNMGTNLASQVFEKIKDAIAQAKPDDYQVYIVGAKFAADHNVFVNEAFNWINKALSISKNFNSYLVKSRLFFIQEKYIDALKAIELCRDAGRNDSDYSSQIAEIDLMEKRIKEKL